MAQNVETGYIKPVASTETFVVSTLKVEEWLQRQINAATAVVKKTNQSVPPVNITVFTLKASHKFHPFVVVLPEEALMSGPGRNDEELSIFNPADSQGTSRILPHIYKILQVYMYNKNNKKAFRTNEMRNTLELSANAAQYLSTVVYPRSENKNGYTHTVMLLDPLRVFFNMVREDPKNVGQDFQIEILKTEHNQGTDYSYTFNKVPNSKRKKGKDLASDIESMMIKAARRGMK